MGDHINDGRHGLPDYDEKSPYLASESTDEKGFAGQNRRKSSVVNAEVLNGELYDERFESTKRGLKSRHAQMIALGGSVYLQRVLVSHPTKC